MNYPIISHGKSINLNGKRFGNLTVLYCTQHVNNSYYWLCKCDCGKLLSVRSDALRSGNTTSCGCSRVISAHYRKERNIKNTIGNIYRNSIVIEHVEGMEHEECKQHTTFFKCKCLKCGNIFISNLSNLRKNKRKNGCPQCTMEESVKNKRKKNDISGQRFGKLLVIKQTSLIKHGSLLYKCVCDCGNEILCDSYSLTKQHTKSCGCLAKENASINGFKNLQKSNGAVSKWEEKITKYLQNHKDVCNLTTQLKLQNKILKYNNKNYYYDISFNVGNNKIIIECNGQVWHSMTPYQTWKHAKSRISASDKYFHDFEKILNAEEQGYDVFVVWDTEPLENICKRLNSLIQFFIRNS